MNSLDPRDFAALPALDSPAAYICVVRDIDSDQYRVQATHSPRTLVGAVVAEERRSFGIELVSVLQSDDLAASEAELYARHHARLGSEWLTLDALQLEELRQSALQIDAFASHYLMTAEPSAAAGAGYRPKRASAAAQRSARQAGGAPAGRRLASRHYGYSALSRRRRRASADHGTALGPISARQAVANWIDDQFTRKPIPVFGVFVIIALVCFGWIRDRELLYRTVNRTHTVVVEPTAAVAERLESRPTPAGKAYQTTQRVPVYRCADIACRRPALLPKGMRVWALAAAKGPVVNGSSVWIEFQLHGVPAYLPVSYLAPLR